MYCILSLNGEIVLLWAFYVFLLPCHTSTPTYNLYVFFRSCWSVHVSSSQPRSHSVLIGPATWSKPNIKSCRPVVSKYLHSLLYNDFAQCHADSWKYENWRLHITVKLAQKEDMYVCMFRIFTYLCQYPTGKFEHFFLLKTSSKSLLDQQPEERKKLFFLHWIHDSNECPVKKTGF